MQEGYLRIPKPAVIARSWMGIVAQMRISYDGVSKTGEKCQVRHGHIWRPIFMATETGDAEVLRQRHSVGGRHGTI